MSEYVNFYKGEHASFSALTSYQPGAFYLTTDTERLYFANAADSILDLNQYIIFVTDIAALSAITKPQRGDIYYCETENVLCTRGDNGWIQININTDTITTSLSTEKTVDDEDSNTIKWTLTLKETTSSEVSSTPREFTATWDISKDDIYDIIPEAQVEVVASVNVTRHAIKYLKELVEPGTKEISAISPGVLGTTGIETEEIIEGVVEKIKPDLIIVIHSLASQSISRIGTTIQMGNTGITPGAGVGNRRKVLNKNTERFSL